MKKQILLFGFVMLIISCQNDESNPENRNENYPIITEVYKDGSIYYKMTYDARGRMSRVDTYQTGVTNQYSIYTYEDSDLQFTIHHYLNDTLNNISYSEPIRDGIQIYTQVRFEKGVPMDTTITERVYFDDVNCGVREEWSVIDGASCLWRETELVYNCNSRRYRLPCQAGQKERYLTNEYEYNDRKNAYGSLYNLSRGHLTKYLAFYSSGDTISTRSYSASVEYGENDYPSKEIRNYLDGKKEIFEFFY